MPLPKPLISLKKTFVMNSDYHEVRGRRWKGGIREFARKHVKLGGFAEYISHVIRDIIPNGRRRLGQETLSLLFWRQ
jgi:hypothetical protein